MITWNCPDCDMAMTLQENIPNVTCPNCGKKMVEIQGTLAAGKVSRDSYKR